MMRVQLWPRRPESHLVKAALQDNVINDVTFDVDMSTSSASKLQLPSWSFSTSAAAASPRPLLHQLPPGSLTQISFTVDKTIDAVDTVSEDSLRRTWWQLMDTVDIAWKDSLYSEEMVATVGHYRYCVRWLAPERGHGGNWRCSASPAMDCASGSVEARQRHPGRRSGLLVHRRQTVTSTCVYNQIWCCLWKLATCSFCVFTCCFNRISLYIQRA